MFVTVKTVYLIVIVMDLFIQYIYIKHTIEKELQNWHTVLPILKDCYCWDTWSWGDFLGFNQFNTVIFQYWWRAETSNNIWKLWKISVKIEISKQQEYTFVQHNASTIYTEDM